MKTEFDIYQNQVIGGILIWEFSKSFYYYSDRETFPSIFHALPVLPICLNRRSTNEIKNRQLKEGSLLKTITENRDIFAGLNSRMEYFAPLTFRSIYFAQVSGLLILDQKTYLIPNNKEFPDKIKKQQREDYKDMVGASRRLGAWFSKLSFDEIIFHFNLQ